LPFQLGLRPRTQAISQFINLLLPSFFGLANKIGRHPRAFSGRDVIYVIVSIPLDVLAHGVIDMGLVCSLIDFRHNLSQLAQGIANRPDKILILLYLLDLGAGSVRLINQRGLFKRESIARGLTCESYVGLPEVPSATALPRTTRPTAGHNPPLILGYTRPTAAGS
jgi:hypothetical protein